MGTIIHHAIVVVGFQPEAVREAHDEALSLGCQVSEIAPAAINGYESFMVAPDGSKEWWDESDCGDTRRADFKRKLRSMYEAGRYLDFVEVAFGELEPTRSAVVVDHAWRAPCLGVYGDAASAPEPTP